MNEIADSRSLNVFLWVAEIGSFAGAAPKLNISPAAVSQTIKRLEDHYGVRLFNRTTRKVSLTTAGRLLHDRCRSPLADLREIEQLFEEERGEVTGAVSISAPLVLVRSTLIPLMSAFRAQHPAIEFCVDVSDTLRDFVDDPIDLALRIGQPPSSAITARRIRDLRAVTVASPAYVSSKGVPTHPEELSEHDCIAYRYPTTRSPYIWAFEVDGVEYTYTPEDRLLFNDPEAACSAAVHGMGILQTADLYVERGLGDGTLVELMSDHRIESRALYLCYPDDKNLPLRVTSFIDFLLSRISS